MFHLIENECLIKFFLLTHSNIPLQNLRSLFFLILTTPLHSFQSRDIIFQIIHKMTISSDSINPSCRITLLFYKLSFGEELQQDPQIIFGVPIDFFGGPLIGLMVLFD